MPDATKRHCGPCNGRCHQGRTCPARAPREGLLDDMARWLHALRRACGGTRQGA